MKRSLLFISVLVSMVSVLRAQGPVTITAVDSITRPYNITAYAANDVVNDSTFTRMLRFKNSNIRTLASGAAVTNDSGVVENKGGGGVIVSALLTVGDSANTANGSFKLLLFRDTIVNVADNAAWATAAYYNTRLVGEIDFSLTNNGTASNYSYVTGAWPFSCASDDRYIYGVLIAKAAYQPVRAQKFIIKLNIIRN